MNGLSFLVEALELLGILRWNSDTTCKYYTRNVYVKVMAGMTEALQAMRLQFVLLQCEHTLR
jgi:hypothetical protein